ncbi:MAG: hypothetical protein KF693_15775 [Nitrospira sp.]|nr:hypothetical protein [Nitrospira sp.]
MAIALGFVLGMYGLDHPESHWLQTALGLLVTGMVAQGYALYCSIKGCGSGTPELNQNTFPPSRASTGKTNSTVTITTSQVWMFPSGFDRFVITNC